MIIPIKGIRNWRISYDNLNWIIQKKIPSNKPPNDWVNKFYFAELESMISTLIKIGIDPSKISNLKALSTHMNKLNTNLKGLIQELFERTGGKLPKQQKK